MAKIIQFNNDDNNPNTSAYISERFRCALEKARKGKIEPLTPAKLRRQPALEKITDKEASEAIATIKKLAAIFFEIAHRNDSVCIDNQQVVNLNQENKAA